MTTAEGTLPLEPGESRAAAGDAAEALPPRWLGLLGYAFYAAHAIYFLWAGRPSNLLWGCHLAALGVGTGILIRFPTFVGMGVLSLLWGVPLWLVDVFTGGEFLPTSMGTHIGGLALGLYGLKKLGIPKHTWLVLWVTTGLLLLLSYGVTNPIENVNMAFGPPKGWEQTFPGHPWFAVITMTGAGGIFIGGELILRGGFGPRRFRWPS